LLASFQDLSQARLRWGTAADGFLTLFGSKLILPGIADTTTLEAVSVALGEYDRRVRTETTHPNQGSVMALGARGISVSTQRQRILSPGEVANIPAGSALHLRGLRWELVRTTPAHTCEPWRSLLGPAAPTNGSIGAH
jgi:type IV secretion system protein VirD4